MRTREVALLLVGLVATGCEKKASTCGPAADGSVVACVGDDAVRRGDALEFLREAQWVAGSARRPDPRPPAVEKAIQLRLLAQEAQRRGLKPPAGAPSSTAVLAQAVLADEVAKHGVSRDTVSLDDARRFYDEHPEAFGQIDEVRMQAVVVADPDLAERVFREAKGADEARFAELVARYSEDAPSKEKRGELPTVHASRGADRDLLTLGLSLRRAGALGGPLKLSDGRYYVVRILAAPVGRIPPFEEGAIAKAKNILVFERKEALGKELTDRLRKSTEVRTFADAIAQLEAPKPAPAPAPSSSP